MNVSFNLLRFTDAVSFSAWKKQQNEMPLVAQTVQVEEDSTDYTFVKMVVLCLYILIAFAWYIKQPEMIALIVGLGFSLAGLLFQSSQKEAIATTTSSYERFLYVGEKIHFLADEIQISTTYLKESHSFLYKDIQHLCLHFIGIKASGDIEASTISWEKEGIKYEYSLSIDSEYRMKQLIGVLIFCYNNQISIREENQEGKTTHLLRVVELPKPEKPQQIDAHIQSLIDEIGEKEEK